MRPITTVVFNHDDCRTLTRVRPLIDLAFPLITDPLAPADRAVHAEHELRRALGSIAFPYDPLTHDRLLRGWQCLDAIRTWVTIQSTESYWIDLAADPRSEQTAAMATALAAERRNQQHLVADAIDLIESALAATSPLDDPRVGEKDDFRDLDEIELDMRADEARWRLGLQHAVAWCAAHGREPLPRGADLAERHAADFLAHQRDAARGRRYGGWSPLRRAALDEAMPGWFR